MNLTVAELARAVGRSETYVRQHIYRKHLATRKEGRRVFVELAEARRWARQRGLPFSPPSRLATSVASMKNRTARMTVLAWEGTDGLLSNLFTLVRHRRRDAMGPWTKEPELKWSVDELTEELRLFSFDGPLEHCEPWIKNMVKKPGRLEIEGQEVLYTLTARPRRHWAYRDRRMAHEGALVSPFLRHSAEIVEHWSFGTEAPGEWRETMESLTPSLRTRFARLGFPLDRRLERAGNLMIASAEDTIACDLVPGHNGTLSLVVDADEVSAGTFRAMVWASHSGDEVLRRVVEVKHRESSIELECDVDRVGFAVWRVADGRCVDFLDECFIMEVPIRLNLESGPTIHLRDRRRQVNYEVGASRYISEFNVRADQDSSELDKSIRRKRLDFRLRERKPLQETGEISFASSRAGGVMRQDIFWASWVRTATRRTRSISPIRSLCTLWANRGKSNCGSTRSQRLRRGVSHPLREKGRGQPASMVVEVSPTEDLSRQRAEVHKEWPER